MTTHIKCFIGRYSRSSASLLCALACFTYSIDALADRSFLFDAEIATTLDNNVSRGLREDDIEKDSFGSATIGVNYLLPINQSNRFVFRGTVRNESYQEFTGLSNNTGTITATYQFRPSGEFRAPTLGAFTKLGIAEYKSDLRDSNLYSVGASIRQAITDRITYAATISRNIRESDGTVFDTTEDSLLANIDYSLARRWTLYLTYNFLNGDVISSGQPWLQVLDVADAVNADDVFGTGAVAYRVKGKTHVVTFGTNFIVTDGHSLDISARAIRTDTVGDFTYKRLQLSAAYLIRF